MIRTLETDPSAKKVAMEAAHKAAPWPNSLEWATSPLAHKASPMVRSEIAIVMELPIICASCVCVQPASFQSPTVSGSMPWKRKSSSMFVSPPLVDTQNPPSEPRVLVRHGIIRTR